MSDNQTPQPTRKPFLIALSYLFMIGGIITFLGAFAVAFTSFDSSQGDILETVVPICFVGMFAIIIGGFLNAAGKGGRAGYMKEIARDAKPAMEELGLTGKIEVVKVRCRSCEKLSAEDAKFCQHCGSKM